MTTAISTNAQTISYPALSPDSRQLRIIEANLDGEPMREQDLVRVKTPAGGGTKWTVNLDGNETTCDEIVGLRDRTVPPTQADEVLQGLAPELSARCVRLPGLGHLAHEEAPEQVAGEILKLRRRDTANAQAPAP